MASSKTSVKETWAEREKVDGDYQRCRSSAQASNRICTKQKTAATRERSRRFSLSLSFRSMICTGDVLFIFIKLAGWRHTQRKQKKSGWTYRKSRELCREIQPCQQAMTVDYSRGRTEDRLCEPFQRRHNPWADGALPYHIELPELIND